MDTADLAGYMKSLGHLDGATLKEVEGLVAKLSAMDRRELAQGSFIEFVRFMWPGFIEGAHHDSLSIFLLAIRRVSSRVTCSLHGSLGSILISMSFKQVILLN